jgi:hypothetical protein
VRRMFCMGIADIYYAAVRLCGDGNCLNFEWAGSDRLRRHCFHWSDSCCLSRICGYPIFHFILLLEGDETKLLCLPKAFVLRKVWQRLNLLLITQSLHAVFITTHSSHFRLPLFIVVLI